MSEFKFACPVCGQHITADSSTSGGQIECPTCFQKIVVPQAPATPDSKFILSAAQVGKPRPVSDAASQLGPLHPPSPRSSLPAVVALLVLLCAAGAAFYIFRDRVFKSSRIPDTTAAGRIHGSEFLCEKAILRGGLLSLNQGKAWPWDLGVSLSLAARQGEEWSGQTIEIAPDRPRAPRVVLRWKNEQQKPATEAINHGYTLKVVFGQATNAHIPGKIYLRLPDPAKSFVAGVFDAEIRKPPPPKPNPPKAPAPSSPPPKSSSPALQ